MAYKQSDYPAPQLKDYGITEEECRNVEAAMKKVMITAKRRQFLVVLSLIIIGAGAFYWFFEHYCHGMGDNQNMIMGIGVYCLICGFISQCYKPTQSLYWKIPKYHEYFRFVSDSNRHWEMRQIFPADDDPLFGRGGDSDAEESDANSSKEK